MGYGTQSTTIQINNLNNSQVVEVSRKDMLPNQYSVSLEGLTIGTIILTPNLITLGNITVSL